jgi:uncharacterized protein
MRVAVNLGATMNSESADPLVVPHAELSAEALKGVVEAFVLREGTDYGATEYSLGQKVAHVLAQLERGEARIVFDPETESIDIVPDRDSSPPRAR